MRMRMRRAGAERGYPGTAWVCCWLLGWQAAALQLPPCEEVRFFLLLRGFSPSLGAGGRSGAMHQIFGGWQPRSGVLLGVADPLRAVRGTIEGSEPRRRSLRRGAARGSEPAPHHAWIGPFSRGSRIVPPHPRVVATPSNAME